MSDLVYVNGRPIGRIVSFDIESCSLNRLDPPSIALGIRTWEGTFTTTFVDTETFSRLFPPQPAPKPRPLRWVYRSLRALPLTAIILALLYGIIR